MFSACNSARYGHRMLRVKAPQKEVVKEQSSFEKELIKEQTPHQQNDVVEQPLQFLTNAEELTSSVKHPNKEPKQAIKTAGKTMLSNTSHSQFQPQDSIRKAEEEISKVDEKVKTNKALLWARIMTILLVISVAITLGNPMFILVSFGLAIAALVLYRNTDKFARRFGFWLAIVILALILLVAVIVGFYLLLILLILGG